MHATVATVVTLGTAGPVSAQTPTLPTIKPGMTEAQVRTEWGQPFTVRSTGRMSYMYYNNDCLKRCGTYDIVFLEGGQVVDAIVRDGRRRYDGISSSPVDRKPEPTTGARIP
jgi:hypothetical protein